MTRRALLIACQTYGLKGCHQDVAQMQACLEQYQFQCMVLKEETATRAGILKALEELIDQSQPQDCAVIYYSGHGGIVDRTDPHPSDPRYCTFLIPTDFDQGENGPFHGILDLEISEYQALLTRKTNNVVQIFDCCHSGRMARDGFRVRALPRYHRSLTQHLEYVRAKFDSNLRHPESNPYAVRLTAAGIHQKAYEYKGMDASSNTHTGLFTEALVEVLGASREIRMGWHQVIARVREWVMAVQPTQRPGLNGPTNRLLFETESVQNAGPAFFYDKKAFGDDGKPWPPPGRPAIRAGTLMGVCAGDIYALSDDQRKNQICRATVEKVMPGIAYVALNPRTFVMTAAPAILKEKRQNRWPVCVASEEKALVEAIQNSPLLEISKETDHPIATVCKTDDGYHIYHSEQLMFHPLPSIDATLRTLANLARGKSLTLLESGKDAFALDQTVTVDWGRVIQKEPCSYKENNTPLQAGDAVYISVTNQGQKTVWVNLINVGISGMISILSRSQLTTGVPLTSGETYQAGRRPYQGLVGLPLSWPTQVPKGDIRTERILAIISDAPQDFTVLETDLIPNRSQISDLQAQLYRLQTGRGLAVRSANHHVRYAVHHLDFEFAPH